MDTFAVIGLGRFGMMLARTLAKAGREVIASDTNRDTSSTERALSAQHSIDSQGTST